VLITGETGTGKGSPPKPSTATARAAKALCVVNCGAIPEHLMESELFGYEKGAFTTPSRPRKGVWSSPTAAPVSDEIGEISMRMQIDLLRVLEDRVFYRVGGTQPSRRISGSSPPPTQPGAGHWRRALPRGPLLPAERGILVMPPAATQRGHSIVADNFLLRYAQETHRPIDKISRETIDEMMIYDWPGNVRELENAIERRWWWKRAPNHAGGPADFMPQAGGRPARNASRRWKKSSSIGFWRNMPGTSPQREDSGIDRSTLYTKIKRYRLQKST